MNLRKREEGYYSFIQWFGIFNLIFIIHMVLAVHGIRLISLLSVEILEVCCCILRTCEKSWK